MAIPRYFQFKFIPMWLTLLRFLSPFFFPILFFIIFDLKYLSKIFGLIVFLIFSFSDFLDGFLARKYNIVTKVGAILDPIGDKLLVITTLITLLHFDKVSLFVCLALVLREVLITSLRLIASSFGVSIEVSDAGKYKMFLQIIYISFAILDLNILSFYFIKSFLGFVVVFLSYYSAAIYFNIFKKKVLL